MDAVPPEFGGSLEQQLGRGKRLLNLGWALNMTSEIVDIYIYISTVRHFAACGFRRSSH